ncbi:hypothetical protein [Deinococcus hopiensis]|uniref:Uncharacterized protein n=1 Tax=Deinococcus hopiensis KR-140 TaxID=695939 RepID=A0A1W1VRT7_9DEIO|nr:hypothetical protein [Deinococcus hopiensis]SMB95930.1 hypothetical protein SAMN00790413_03076 [Deinococcus hopiensis KR-140]
MRAGLDVTARLRQAPDLRADVARMTLKLPEGLTVPATIRLRDGRTQELTLLGRLAVLRSFGLTEATVVSGLGQLAARRSSPRATQALTARAGTRRRLQQEPR